MDDQPGPAVPDRTELALLRAAVEGGLDGMVVVSADGRIVTSNRRFAEIWPIPAEVVASGSDEAALASVLDKLVDPDAFLVRVHELYGTASGAARDELLLRDGRVLDRYGAALRDARGDYIGWAWYFRDVTLERAAVVDAGRLGALIAVAQRLADARSEEDVLGVVSGDGASVLGAAGAVLCLAEPGAARVRTLATGFFDEGLRAEVAELPADAPLPVVRVATTGEAVFLADRDEALARFPGARDSYVRARAEGAGVVPLTSHGRTTGSLGVVFTGRHPWRTADRALLQALAALTAQALDRLRAQAAEQEATREVRRLGEALQHSLLTPLPSSPLLQLAARYRPAARAARVGGDWYDAFPGADGCTTLVVGDVAGHDRAAAVAMAQVRNVLRGVSVTVDGGPARVLAALDRALRRLDIDTLATAVLCQASAAPDDPRPRAVRLRWSNAGHPPPLLVHPDGTAEFLARVPELLLGVAPDRARTDHEVTLAPGATVVLYTDGLVERRDQDLDAGSARLRAVAGELGGLAPDRLCDALLDRLAAGSEDDVALLVVRVAD
ncbi:Serine phosphatase RsbU, regulator of sigma subunit [Geodermatophilus pulveris]|uniref:Serine phosphatase RsbU, regulator of sigma subunit n=1 Tax=Geodermatophilus pulveris TaxID=1564159 RepID=A0A239F5G7_9ACTN|nr:SpoIIE family protein phosphatase [Geodermatophilus pulveris]SNS51748.1 Serine phosphatase RsbU, regulator of sigma subunit [Geodermatophilus pulveris]